MYWKATAVTIDPKTGDMIADPETFEDFAYMLYAAAHMTPFPFVPSSLVEQLNSGEPTEFAHDIRTPLTLVPLIPPGYRQHVEVEHPELLADFEQLASSYIQVEPQDVPATA